MKLIKSLMERIPPSVGILLNQIPFHIRLGNRYNDYKYLIHKLSQYNESEKLNYVNRMFKRIHEHHYSYNEFYKEYVLSKYSDIKSNRILTKADLKNVPLDLRTTKEFAMAKYNTGGTSGNPLSFYVEYGFYAREWAHMHFMWERLGYKPSDTKITIRGKKIRGLYQYNFNQNEFLVNAYADTQESDYKKLLTIFKKYNTKFIHGYPSAIYSFIKKVESHFPELLVFLKQNIKGIMFGSEYPLPLYRNYIEDMVTSNSISWYGHTEAVILAGELYEKYEYVPFLSYGYAEAVLVDGSYHLVGTCFDNKATPFIRYDTQDLIEPFFSPSGLLEKFKIKEGRIGEFVKDMHGNLISLTGLIFGRHHQLFDNVDHIQVSQSEPGKLIIFFSSKSKIVNPQSMFDDGGVAINFEFIQYDEPIRTQIGKMPLLISNK